MANLSHFPMLSDDIAWEVSKFLSPADALNFAVARGDRPDVARIASGLSAAAAELSREILHMLSLDNRDRLAYATGAGYTMTLTEAGEREFTRTIRDSLTAYLYDVGGSRKRPNAGLSFYPRGATDTPAVGSFAGMEIAEDFVSADRLFPAALVFSVMRVAQS